ncbi:MAG: PRTRC system ThiF family protein [Candidatus Manganitrophaceae bacterium]
MRHYVRFNNNLRPVEIHLVGSGGTGSALATRLVQLNTALLSLGHPGLKVIVYDPDIVSEANIGRQMFYAADVGHPKASVLVTRINQCTGFSWEAVPGRYSPTGGRSPDLLISAVDTGQARIEIGEILRRGGACPYWLDCGNNRTAGQVVLGTIREVEQPKIENVISQLPTVIDLYPEIKNPPREADQGPSCSLAEAIEQQDLFINQFVAIESVELLWKIFRQGFVEYSVAYVSLTPRSSSVLLIDPKAWKRFGYRIRRPRKKKEG